MDIASGIDFTPQMKLFWGPSVEVFCRWTLFSFPSILTERGNDFPGFTSPRGLQFSNFNAFVQETRKLNGQFMSNIRKLYFKFKMCL